MIGVAPLFAPTVGGFIAELWGWRAVFAVLAGLGVLVLAMCWRFFPESHPIEARSTGGIGTALRSYKILLSDRKFLALALLPGLVNSALMAYVSGSPFVLQEQLGLSTGQFSLFFAIGGIALVGMAQVNAAIVHRYSPIRIIRLALPLQLTIILGLLVVALTGFGERSASSSCSWRRSPSRTSCRRTPRRSHSAVMASGRVQRLRCWVHLALCFRRRSARSSACSVAPMWRWPR